MTLDTLIMIRINADVLFGFCFCEWIFTDIYRSELMLVLKVRPAPYSTINNVRLIFPVTDLPARIELKC